MCGALFRHLASTSASTKHLLSHCPVHVRVLSKTGNTTGSTVYKFTERNISQVNSWFRNGKLTSTQIASISRLCCKSKMDLAEIDNVVEKSSLTMMDNNQSPIRTPRDIPMESTSPWDNHERLVLPGEQPDSRTHDVNATCNQSVHDDQSFASVHTRNRSDTGQPKTPTILKGSVLSKVSDLVRENPQIVPVDRRSSHDDLHDDIQPSTSLVATDLTVPMDTCTTKNGSPEKRVAHSQSNRQANKRRKKNSPNTNHSELGSENQDPRQRPNYFVAIQVTDPQVHRRLKMVQDHILSQEPRLSAAREPLAVLHITILVVYLADDEDIKRAIQAMDDCRDTLRDLERDLVTLNIVGVDNFRDNVVFANVEDSIQKEKLCRIAETVRHTFSGRGLMLTDDRAFSPHLTLFKLSKAPKLRKKGVRKIARALYEEVTTDYFGSQEVTGLQLCSMLKPKDHRGYYHTDHTVQLSAGAAGELTVPDDDEAVSSFSKTLASDVIARAIEVLWEERLAQSRADKLARKPKGKPPNKQLHRSKTDGVVSIDNRKGHVAVVQLHKELSWSFEKGHLPNLDDVIGIIKSASSNTND